MPEIVQKVWGHEEVIVNNHFYCGKFLKVIGGSKSSLHYHRKKMETFHVLYGEIILRIDLESRAVNQNPPQTFRRMKPGDTEDIFPWYAHSFQGIENSTIVEFSTHHSDDDVVRLEPSVAP